jgi:hypothetical protein
MLTVMTMTAELEENWLGSEPALAIQQTIVVRLNRYAVASFKPSRTMDLSRPEDLDHEVAAWLEKKLR